MVKKKILKGQKKLKTNTLLDFDTKQIFKDMSVLELQKVLYEVWIANDLDSFKGILSAFLNIHNKQKIASKMGVSRNTLYQMVSPEGNPTIETIFKLMKVLEKETA